MPNRTISSTFLFSRAIALLFLFATLCPAHAQAGPNSNEKQVAKLMKTRGQLRPQLVYDPILARVARERAEDMAKRGYFDHVNPDGMAANILLRKAGYRLPSWWGSDPKANYVESLAAGQISSSSVWSSWMNSPLHKKHLLALDPFYKQQTHYGVGFVASPKSKYRYYWVVITAPPAEAP